MFRAIHVHEKCYVHDVVNMAFFVNIGIARQGASKDRRRCALAPCRVLKDVRPVGRSTLILTPTLNRDVYRKDSRGIHVPHAAP